jgi:hypothetical protein
MERKLNFELVPDGCWYSNLRSILSPKDWNMIKKDAKVRSGGVCSICGKKTDKLDAHEVWSYDVEKGVQKLENVISVCKDCHSVIHIGYTQLKGNIERAEQHYQKVNACTYAEYRQDLNKANILHKERNKVSEWKLDLTWLKRFLDN